VLKSWVQPVDIAQIYVKGGIISWTNNSSTPFEIRKPSEEEGRGYLITFPIYQAVYLMVKQLKRQ
jgi:hypothetical protein